MKKEIPLSEKKEMVGEWFPKGITGKKFIKFAEWLNKWGNEEKHTKYQQEEDQESFSRGYSQAIRDVFSFLKLNFKFYDKRTKTGFKKLNKKQDLRS